MGVHSGKRITFPIFVTDLVRTIEAAFSRGRPGEMYNVVGPCLTHGEVHQIVSRLAGIRSWRIDPPGFTFIWLARVWTLLARYTGREPYYSINMAPYVFCDWNATSEKAERELGLATTPFEEGAYQTLAWYHRQGIGPTNWSGRLIFRLWRLPAS